MRIIAGKYKGRILPSPRSSSVRPAMDNVKGTIFNILQNRLDLTDARVLDLFAGTGSLGLEAISRGASTVIFVDNAMDMLESIRSNAARLDCIAAVETVRGDALSFVENGGEAFDLVFADPPYAYEQTADIPRIVFQHNILKRGGFLIIEHSRRTILLSSPLYKIEIEKVFGNTRLSFIVHPS